jgi:N-acetyl-alpha-D-muramate 1-phosphate uridylyltransferase
MLPCAILCGGLATRLRPQTDTIPKSLIPIAGKPFIAHQLRLLQSGGISRVVLCVRHFAEQIEAFVGNGSRFDLVVTYSYDGPNQLGTGGALRNALPLLTDAFFVLYGDSYLPCDYKHVADVFRSSGRSGLMTIFRNQGKFDVSNVEASNGRIVKYDKRNPTSTMSYIDYGLGVFKASAFANVPTNECYDLAEVYQNLLTAGDLTAYEVSERFYEIGSPEGINDLETYLCGRTANLA